GECPYHRSKQRRGEEHQDPRMFLLHFRTPQKAPSTLQPTDARATEWWVRRGATARSLQSCRRGSLHPDPFATSEPPTLSQARLVLATSSFSQIHSKRSR